LIPRRHRLPREGDVAEAYAEVDPAKATARKIAIYEPPR
jgi:hypothetical protein